MSVKRIARRIIAKQHYAFKQVADKQPWEMTREEFGIKYNTLFHQTSQEAAVKILANDGFSLDYPRARLGDDEMPDAVFLKPHANDIGVGDHHSSTQIEVLIKPGAKFKRFIDRGALKRFLSADDQYLNLKLDSDDDDKDRAKEIKTLAKELLFREDRDPDKRSEYYRRQDEILEKGHAAPSVARKRATEYLKEQGIDVVVVQHDIGFLGRTTMTFAVLDPEMLIINPHQKAVEAANREGKPVPTEILRDPGTFRSRMPGMQS